MPTQTELPQMEVFNFKGSWGRKPRFRLKVGEKQGIGAQFEKGATVIDLEIKDPLHGSRAGKTHRRP